MEPKRLGLLVVLLFFLLSLLVNLLQRRYSRNRLDRLLENNRSVVNFLGVIDEYLGKLERGCVFDLRGASSPQEVGKAIYVAREKLRSTIAAMEEHLRFHDFGRKKEKRQQSQMKHLKKSLKKESLK